MFTWASMKITLNSTVVNEKQMRNHLLKWPRPSVSGGGHLLFRLNDRVGKTNKACWVKHPFIPLLEPDKGFPAKNSSLPFPAILSNPLMDMVSSYTPSLSFILRWSQLQQQCTDIFRVIWNSLPSNIHSRNNIYCANVFSTRKNINPTATQLCSTYGFQRSASHRVR